MKSLHAEGRMEEKSNELFAHHKPYTVAFQTLGCKVNRYETDAVREAFLRAGFLVKDDKEPTDVYVINTCTVTKEADRKSRQMIRRAERNRPGTIVVAMGCQVEMSKSESEAHLSSGTHMRSAIVERVLRRLAENDPGESSSPVDTAGYEELGPVVSQEETRAYIKIQDGCDSFCSYCIIPFARGRVVSRVRDEILSEANALARAGFREIVITGIHICSYGKERGEGLHELIDLLYDISRIEGLDRIRLGSLEPTALTEEFLSLLAENMKLCPHFHVSLQSGSDSVLRRMNRRYDTGFFANAIATLRRYFPDASVTTDIITGFPMETEEEHAESLAFCARIGFAKIHVFPFSERKGTKAAGMHPKIQPEVKARRSDDFLALSDTLSLQYHRTNIGKIRSVLVEQIHKDEIVEGYSENYIRVRFKAGGNVVINDIRRVIIKEADVDGIAGE